MNIGDSAVRLNQTPRYVRRLIESKQLPAIRLNSRDYYIDLSDLEKWLKPPRCRGAMRLH